MNEPSDSVLLRSAVLTPGTPIEAPAIGDERASRHAITVSWARHQDEVREAQRLRYYLD